jgi:fructosamine-3-kinase
MVTAAGFVLIDPAAHGGHRITDLAMLALFGAPYLEVTLAAYEGASRWLPPRWRDLIGLHQLHPLLVHAALFGGSYGPQAVSVSRTLL